MIRNLGALISLAVVFSGMFALSTESAEAKTSRDISRRAGDYFVPPPPPYAPSIVPSALGMTNAQAATADADDALVEKPVNPYSKYIFEPKTSRNSSRRAGDYFVPPPPPYTPSIVPSALGMTNAQVVIEGEMPQVVQPNPYVSYDRAVETRIQKQIDSFDSKISSAEKEIGKLLNL